MADADADANADAAAAASAVAAAACFSRNAHFLAKTSFTEAALPSSGMCVGVCPVGWGGGRDYGPA